MSRMDCHKLLYFKTGRDNRMLVSYSLSVYINTTGENMFSVRRCWANYPCSTEKNVAMATSLGQPMGWGVVVGGGGVKRRGVVRRQGVPKWILTLHT